MNIYPLLALDAVASQGAPFRVLRFLWRSRAEWSGREVARQAGLSAPSTHQALKRLYARGLVRFRRVSNVHLYQTNQDNRVLQSVIAPYFQAEEAVCKELDTTIVETLACKGLLSIICFGSRARGDSGPGSDLDLLIIVSTKETAGLVEERADALRSLLGKRFNIPLAPLIQTLYDLRRKHRGGLPFYGNVLIEGRRLYGRDLAELVA